MTGKQKIQLFYYRARKELEGKGCGEGDYCVIVYVGGNVKFVYRSLYKFLLGVEGDIKDVDKMLSIHFQTWIFD